MLKNQLKRQANENKFLGKIESYTDFKHWITDVITDANVGKKINFDKIIKKASSMPLPGSSEEYTNLIDSGLCYSFDELAFILATSVQSVTSRKEIRPNKNDIDISLVNSLSELWNIFEKHFLKDGWDNYVFHLQKTNLYLKKLSAYKSYYHNITHTENKCYNPAFETPNKTTEFSEFYLKHSSKFLDLSRTSLLGCEGFAHACLWLNNDSVFEKIYLNWKSPNISKPQLAWLPYIICAGELRRADILKDIWASMKGNYRQFPFYITIFLLHSAERANVDEITKYFDELNTPSFWDLSTSHNPYLDSFLSTFSIDKNPKSIMQLEYRSFEGKFWNAYFKHKFEQNTNDAVNLFNENQSILRLRDKDLNDWNITFCLAQETYARQLRFRLFNELQDQFSYLANLDNDNYLKEIATGNISTRIKGYQNQVEQILNQRSFLSKRDEILENKFLPFIDCFLSNHISFLEEREKFYQWQNDETVKIRFFKKAENFYKKINTEKISEIEWQYFLYLLSAQIQNNINSYFLRILSGEFHSMKRTFAKEFENNLLLAKADSKEKDELIKKAKNFLRNISSQIPKYRITDPKKIDIIPGIEKHLLQEYYETSEDFFPGCISFYIAGYDGIYEDYLKPMLIEIRFNAEKAMSKMPEGKRHYRIKLDYGKNEYSGFGILSVINNFVKNDYGKNIDLISTGRGKRNIQYYATRFQQGDRDGWAEFISERKNYDNFFKVEIYLPLWEESGGQN